MSSSLPKQWLDRATEDLTVARLVLGAGHTAHTCFLSQQCIEKSLKAYLLARTNSYPRVHRLVDLIGECETLEPAFSKFLTYCIIVDQYYIPTRYPDGIPGGAPGGMPGKAEAREALIAAEEILQFVVRQLP
jgi:HEPN domain-containing protein